VIQRLANDLVVAIRELDGQRLVAEDAARLLPRGDLAALTLRLRGALDRADGIVDLMQTLLDKLEEAAGLIDQDGRRVDE
jgi:hypothetical protein